MKNVRETVKEHGAVPFSNADYLKYKDAKVEGRDEQGNKVVGVGTANSTESKSSSKAIERAHKDYREKGGKY